MYEKESPIPVRATRLLRDLAWNAFCIFLFLIIVGLALDVHPVIQRADRIINKQLDGATGSYESSTCAFYRGEISELEFPKWASAAKKEGDAKCIEADIVLSQNSYAMKARYVVYQYIPWESGTLLSMSRDVVLYIIASAPFLGMVFRFFFYGHQPHTQGGTCYANV